MREVLLLPQWNLGTEISKRSGEGGAGEQCDLALHGPYSMLFNLPEAFPVNRKTCFAASDLGDFNLPSLNKCCALATFIGDELDSEAVIDLSRNWSRASAHSRHCACEPLRATGVPDTPPPVPLPALWKGIVTDPRGLKSSFRTLVYIHIGLNHSLQPS